MQFEILENNQVVKVEKVETGTQTAIIKTPIGMKNRIAMTADKTSLSLNEAATFTLKWLVFDTTAGGWIDDPGNASDFHLDVAGTPGTLAVTDGSFTFSSAEPGEYTVRTTNPGVDNAEIKVVVS